MIKDPLTTWTGPFPYDELAPAGVTPEFSHAQMADVSFTLMTRRMMNPRTQKAWDELRDPQRRLLADLLLYDVDPAEEIARSRAARPAAPPPDPPPELAAALTVPADAATHLAEELSEITLAEPPAPAWPDLGVFPPPSLVDGLIEFDR